MTTDNPAKPVGRFAAKVAQFKKDATWLADEDGLALVMLEALAEEIDVKLTAALLAQFGLTYRSLLAKHVPHRGEEDLLEGLLER